MFYQYPPTPYAFANEDEENKSRIVDAKGNTVFSFAVEPRVELIEYLIGKFNEPIRLRTERIIMSSMLNLTRQAKKLLEEGMFLVIDGKFNEAKECFDRVLLISDDIEETMRDIEIY